MYPTTVLDGTGFGEVFARSVEGRRLLISPPAPTGRPQPAPAAAKGQAVWRTARAAPTSCRRRTEGSQRDWLPSCIGIVPNPRSTGRGLGYVCRDRQGCPAVPVSSGDRWPWCTRTCGNNHHRWTDYSALQRVPLEPFPNNGVRRVSAGCTHLNGAVPIWIEWLANAVDSR